MFDTAEVTIMVSQGH